MFRLATVFTVIFIMTGMIPAVAQSDGPTGNLSGKIIDQSTQQTIPGANVVIRELDRGTSSNADGAFTFENIPAGIYTIEISFVGYRTRTLTDIVVRGNRTTSIEPELREQVVEGDEVTVSAGYFHRSDTETVSSRSLTAEEIRRSPGGGQELARVISTTPGVVTTGETSQDLMVRGGSPRENAFYIDNIYLPGIQHFEELDGSSNGPIGLINTELVDQLDFYAGGFSASYGGKMSSVGNIKYREASRERRQATIDMSLAGFGGSLETPVADGSGSWLVSLRRSYLDLIAGAINAGGAPRYGDVQAKGVYDLNDSNKLTFLQIYGDSRFSVELDDALEYGLLSRPIFENRQNTTGLNWRSIWSDSHYSNTSVSYSFTNQSLESTFVDDQSIEAEYDNRHDYLNFRNVNYWRASDRFRFEYGADLNYTKGSFDYYFAPFTNQAGVERPEVVRNLDKERLDGELFGTAIIKPTDQTTINAGIRTGKNNLNRDFTFSPRLSASWEATDRLTLNASGGIYRQNLPLFIRSQQLEFDSLKDPYSRHLVAGFDYLLGDATKFSVEFYDKQYRQLPVQPEGYDQGFPSYVFDTQTFYDELSDHGEGYARGVDLMLHRKMKSGLYGTISGSVFRSRYKDFSGEWQNRDFDVEYLLSAIGGYRPSQKWEFSARWTYIGSRPFTPIDIARSSQAGQTILDGTRYNSELLPAFHSLYLRMDRRIFLDRLTIVTFVEMWNAYNRSNVESVYWNRNTGQPDEFNQFSVLPVGGFTIEF